MQLKRLQQCQLEILDEFKRVCEVHNIRYYLTYGTCIGAVRHKGFIPWDDDIDVFMTVDDIKKLEAVQGCFKSNFYLQSHKVEKDYGLLIHRIRKSDTTLIEDDHSDRDINHGVYIDIYPLFNCYKDGYRKKLLSYSALVCRLFAYNAPPKNKGKLLTVLSGLLLNVVPSKLRDIIEKKLLDYILNVKETGYMSTIVDITDGVIYNKDWFGDPIFVDFEGEKLPIPAQYDCVLRTVYGDYMQLPPPEKRVVHHNYLFVDLERPYVDYKGIHYCINEQ